MTKKQHIKVLENKVQWFGRHNAKLIVENEKMKKAIDEITSAANAVVIAVAKKYGVLNAQGDLVIEIETPDVIESDKYVIKTERSPGTNGYKVIVASAPRKEDLN